MENFENNRLTNDEYDGGGNGGAEQPTKIFYEFALECLCVDAMCTDANALNQFPILALTHPHTNSLKLAVVIQLAKPFGNFITSHPQFKKLFNIYIDFDMHCIVIIYYYVFHINTYSTLEWDRRLSKWVWVYRRARRTKLNRMSRISIKCLMHFAHIRVINLYMQMHRVECVFIAGENSRTSRMYSIFNIKQWNYYSLCDHFEESKLLRIKHALFGIRHSTLGICKMQIYAFIITYMVFI